MIKVGVWTLHIFCENLEPMFQQTHSKLEHVHWVHAFFPFSRSEKAIFLSQICWVHMVLNTSKIVIIEGNSGSDGKGEWSEMVRASVEEGW